MGKKSLRSRDNLKGALALVTMPSGVAERRLGATGRGRARHVRRAGVLVGAGLVLATAAHAQNADWLSNASVPVSILAPTHPLGTLIDYNNGGNWSTNTPPTGTATFGATSGSNIGFSDLLDSNAATVGGWTFNA
jgi:hypothetical protein